MTDKAMTEDELFAELTYAVLTKRLDQLEETLERIIGVMEQFASMYDTLLQPLTSGPVTTPNVPLTGASVQIHSPMYTPLTWCGQIDSVWLPDNP